MPLTTPIAGTACKVTYGATPTTCAVTEWTYKPMGNTIDVSNGVDGRRRIAGLPDCEGTFKLHVDTAATYEADLAKGTLVTLNFFTDSAKKYSSIAAIIEDVEYSNSVEGTYDATFTWKLASGTAPDAPA